MKKIKFNEWIEGIEKMTANDIPPFPKGGTNGVYLPALTEKLVKLNGNEIKVFMVICSGMNEYNQYPCNREETAKVAGIKYDRGNMTRIFKKLAEEEMVVLFDRIPTVNPFLVLPSVSNPKVKATLQRAWEDSVIYNDTHF